LPFQIEAWEAYLAGCGGLIHAPTGVGKTLAAWMGPVAEELDLRARGQATTRGLRVLWITPLRALASDTAFSLREPLEGLGLDWRVELRTGDTSSTLKAKQRRDMPQCLVTTPESATLLLTYPESRDMFASLRAVVVDEWHELLGTKRGVQTELLLARLRTLAPGVRTWGLSATLGNLDEARDALLGVSSPAREGVLIRGVMPKAVRVDVLLPDSVDTYPWAGHIGTRLADKVAARLDDTRSTLLFTNTRSQAEIWFRALMRARPDLVGEIGLHHGSLDRDVRDEVESRLKGTAETPMRCVVCTSSLDLGVDFSPVEQVVQVGSPKGVSRLIQRAGRSGHQPGNLSRILCVPAHAFELVEFAALRDAIALGVREGHAPLRGPLDVLAQHVVTIATGTGFEARELLAEVRSTHAYRDLTDQEWSWVLDFAQRGGQALTAYPQYARVLEQDGAMRIASPTIARWHRMGVGTITADPALRVQYVSGKVLGHIEEDFITRLRERDRFIFAGKVLELVRVREMTAYVRPATRTSGAVPRWNGGRFPLSTLLADAVLARFERATLGEFEGEDMLAARPLLERQMRESALPTPGVLLIEQISLRGTHHAFVFLFAGRLAHEGLGALLSLRLGRMGPRTTQAVATDYGIELASDDELELTEDQWRTLLSPERLTEDLLEALDAAQLARRTFRDIARVAGLIRQGYPGERVRASHLQASSDMFYDVLAQFDPECMLLEQARREVLSAQLEVQRIRSALERAAACRIDIRRPRHLTPLAFPLWAESLRATTVSTEKWEDRVRRMAMEIEASIERDARGADDGAPRRRPRKLHS
jgi:ATP-dependent Lhr-like helicase